MVACGLWQGVVPYDSLAAEAFDQLEVAFDRWEVTFDRLEVAFRWENPAVLDRGKPRYASLVELVSFAVDQRHQMKVEVPTGPDETLGAHPAFLALALLYAHQEGSPGSQGLGGQSPVVAAHS